MSLYYINKVFYKLDTDEDFLAKFRRNVDEALKELSLTAAEVAAVKAGDIVTLYQMGAHPFLLNSLSRHKLCGVNQENYLARIKKLGKKRLAKKV